MGDLFPRGSIADRRLWSERHPWLAGLYYSAMLTPLMAVFVGLRSGRWTATPLVSALVFPLAWVLFSLLVKRSNRRSGIAPPAEDGAGGAARKAAGAGAGEAGALDP